MAWSSFNPVICRFNHTKLTEITVLTGRINLFRLHHFKKVVAEQFSPARAWDFVKVTRRLAPQKI